MPKPLVLQLHLLDAEDRWHLLRQHVEVPDYITVFPGLLLHNTAAWDIPRAAPEQHSVTNILVGIIYDVEMGCLVGILKPTYEPTYTVQEWLTDHPRWQYYRAEDSEADDWLQGTGMSPADFPQGPGDDA